MEHEERIEQQPQTRRGTRRRIAPNIYEDDIGIAAVARAAGHRPQEKRFEKGTPQKDINAWLDRTRTQMRKTARLARALRGTLAGDILVYLELVPDGNKRRDARNLLSHWSSILGTKRRSQLDASALQAVMDQWIADGIAASTVKHRRRELAKLWTTLDGKKADNPVRETTRPAEPDAEARAIPIDIAAAIINLMPDTGRRIKGFRVTPIDRSKTKARLRVMLWTGLSQSTLMRVATRDIQLDAKTLYVKPRRKGQGVSGATLPLLPEAVDALRAFLRAFAWGKFRPEAMNASFQRAVKAYRQLHPAADLPKDLRPYDLRHTFLTEVYLRTGDLKAVKDLGQHADIRTSERYVQAAASIRARMAIESVAKARGTDAEKAKSTILKTGT